MLRRRLILDRDPPIDWPDTFSQIRRHGFGSSEICFTLNIQRDILTKWERQDNKPNFENGRAILKLLEYLKTVSKMKTLKDEIAA